MKFGYTILYVRDVGETVDFYCKAFSLTLKFIHESNQYAEMETGQTTLAFAAETLAQNHGFAIEVNRTGKPLKGFEIAFVTDDVGAAFDKAVKAGAKALSSPEKKPWGQTVAYVCDMNGMLVEICNPMHA